MYKKDYATSYSWTFEKQTDQGCGQPRNCRKVGGPGGTIARCEPRCKEAIRNLQDITRSRNHYITHHTHRTSHTHTHHFLFRIVWWKIAEMA